VQVDVELPVGEAVGDPVRPVHGQSGLPHSGGPLDGRDDHRVGGFGEQLVQRGERAGAAGEVPRRSG
jgi:hypothetical protein